MGPFGIWRSALVSPVLGPKRRRLRRRQSVPLRIAVVRIDQGWVLGSRSGLSCTGPEATA